MINAMISLASMIFGFGAILSICYSSDRLRAYGRGSNNRRDVTKGFQFFGLAAVLAVVAVWLLLQAGA